nr:FAD-dependent oxidoreductase [uncultured Hyphomonas sp.]
MSALSRHIVILGAGFAALTAARTLRKADRTVRITLVAPRPEFHYLPSLIWVPTGLREPDALIHPLNRFFQRHDITYHAGRVTGLADGGRTVLTDTGEIPNDGLIIATGGRFLKKLPGIEHALTICDGVDAARTIRDRLHALKTGRIALGFASNPQEPGAMRGGPMFEMLFGIDTWLRKQGRRDQVDVTFFCPSPRPGARLGEQAVDGLLAEMKRRNIAPHLGHKMKAFTETSVETEGGTIPADLILFMPGLTGPDWASTSGLPLSPGGFFQADGGGKVADSERVYVAGDAGSYPGPDWLPKQAHIADLQAEAAANNLLAELAGRPASEQFRPELVCIIDSLDKGMLVFRNERRSFTLPSTRLFHWAKRFFEGRYVRPYRS